MLVTVQQVKGVSDYFDDAVNSPAHAVDAALLPARSGEVRRSADSRFTIADLPGWPEKAAVRLYRGVVGPGRVPNFWVLGDAQLLYAILDRKPPYQIAPYDSSPIDEQRQVLKRLRQSRPPYMIWSREVLMYADAVPLAIRTPLLYEYGVRNYVPLRRSASYDVLRRRRPGEPLAAAYWQRYMPHTLKLLYIPSYSRALDSPACRSGSDCAGYAVAQSDKPVDGQAVKLAFKAGGRTYWVTFRARTGVDRYPIRLDRLWFSSIVGAHPRVRTMTPNWSVHVTGLRTGDTLY
jgi:hypothetical protein